MAAGKQSAWTGCSRFTSFHSKKCQHQAIKARAPSFNLSWTLSPHLFLQCTGSCDSMIFHAKLSPVEASEASNLCRLWRTSLETAEWFSDTCHGPRFWTAGALSVCKWHQVTFCAWKMLLKSSWLLWYLIFCYVNVVNVLSWGTTHESPVVSLPWAGRLHLNQIFYT